MRQKTQMEVGVVSLKILGGYYNQIPLILGLPFQGLSSVVESLEAHRSRLRDTLGDMEEACRQQTDEHSELLLQMKARHYYTRIYHTHVNIVFNSSASRLSSCCCRPFESRLLPSAPFRVTQLHLASSPKSPLSLIGRVQFPKLQDAGLSLRGCYCLMITIRLQPRVLNVSLSPLPNDSWLTTVQQL